MSDGPLENLHKLPRSQESHLWADYVELLCLANLDGEASQADVLDRVRAGQDLVRERADPRDGGGPAASAEEMAHAEFSDKEVEKVKDWFRHLEYRQRAFEGFYPFTLSEDGHTLLRLAPMTQRRKLYVFLLVASNLRCIKKGYWNKITAAFEYASRDALRSYLPDGAKTYVFGKNMLNRGGRYSGRLWDKINRLAEDLVEKVLVSEDEFGPSDTGDHGLDVVGWVPIGDTAPGFLLVFSQCTCNMDWHEKQWQSSRLNWDPVITFTSPPNNLVFIPYCFRNADGSWRRRRDIKRSILVDRLRLIHLLRKEYGSLRTVTFEVVNEALKYREPVF